jgi:hypothetical protein
LDYKNKTWGYSLKSSFDIKPVKPENLWVKKINEDGTFTLIKYKGKDLTVEIPAIIGKKKVSAIGDVRGWRNESLFIDHPDVQSVNNHGRDRNGLSEKAFSGCQT